MGETDKVTCGKCGMFLVIDRGECCPMQALEKASRAYHAMANDVATAEKRAEQAERERDEARADLNKIVELTPPDYCLAFGGHVPTYVHAVFQAAQREIRDLRKVVADLGDAADTVHKEAAVIQPFLDVWKKHGALIEECRRREFEVSNDR